MKNSKKILLLFVLLGFALLLTSCGKKNTTEQFAFYQLKDPSTLVVEDLDKSKQIEGISYYFVNYTGQAIQTDNPLEPTVYYLLNDNSEVALADVTNEQLSQAYAKKYLYEPEIRDKKNQKLDIPSFEIIQYKKDLENVRTQTYVNYLGYDAKGKQIRNGASMTTTYIFTGEDIIFFNVSSTGDVNEIDLKDITFSGHPNKVGGEAEQENILPNGAKEYVNNHTYTISGSYENNTFEFMVRLAGTYKPLNPQTASFWNWIFLQMPIAYFMAFVSKLFNNSFAMGIIITTIVVRTLAWPIYAKTNDMSMKMSIAQPDLDRLNKKYATRKDPESQQKMQMEMMQIYKKHNISMWGCLLPFLQMPIFFAMFEVVRRITIPGGIFYENVQNTKFFFTDLNDHGSIAKIIFTALVGITMFVLQKISSMKPSYAKKPQKSQANPQAQQQEQTMKMVSFFMIFMMIMTSFVTPGLALSYYWIIGNIYSIGQTLFNKYINEKKYKKLQEEKLYGKSKEIIDAEFKVKGDK